jgi:outer membrane protein
MVSSRNQEPRGFSEGGEKLSRPNAARSTGIPKELSIRMKRSLALVLMLASGFALSAAAQTTPASAVEAPAGPAKIAVIAFQVAVAQTNEGQRNFADLQRKFEPKRQQLKTLSDQIDTLTKQLQAQGDTLSDTERANRARTIDDKKKELQRSAEDAQTDFQQQMQDMYNTLASKVYDVLASYAKQHGYAGAGRCPAAESGALCQRFEQYHQAGHRGIQPEVGCARPAGPAG